MRHGFFLAAIATLAATSASVPARAVEQWCVNGPYILFFQPGSDEYGEQFVASAQEILDLRASSYRDCRDRWRQEGDPYDIDMVITGHIREGEPARLAFARAQKVARAMFDRSVERERVFVQDLGALQPYGFKKPDSRVEMRLVWRDKKR